MLTFGLRLALLVALMAPLPSPGSIPHTQLNAQQLDLDTHRLTLQVSRNLYPKGAQSNALGVYPIRVEWQVQSPLPLSGLQVERRSADANEAFRPVSPILPATAHQFIDSDAALRPTERYFYRVVAYDLSGQRAFTSSEDWGYGALTPKRYFVEYTKTIQSSQKRMDLLNRSFNLSKLGKETIRGLRSGKAVYDAHVSGLGAEVIIEYSQFEDANQKSPKSFVLNGFTNVDVSMLANGRMKGAMNVMGLFPGHIDYDHIEIKDGEAGGGYYLVTPKGHPTTRLQWNFQ